MTDWHWLGGTFNSPPTVVSWESNRLDIFGLGGDNQLYHKSWNGEWNPQVGDWDALGGTFSTPVAAMSRGPNLIYIFGLGGGNIMYHKSWDGSKCFHQPLAGIHLVTSLIALRQHYPGVLIEWTFSHLVFQILCATDLGIAEYGGHPLQRRNQLGALLTVH
jgi:hypothetical protein